MVQLEGYTVNEALLTDPKLVLVSRDEGGDGVTPFDEEAVPLESQLVWRAAEALDSVPLGTEFRLTGDELLVGNRGVGRTLEGTAIHIEQVADIDLDGFLARRRASGQETRSPEKLSNEDLCNGIPPTYGPVPVATTRMDLQQ